MRTAIPSNLLDEAMNALKIPNASLAKRYPGESADRQPVHTVYGGAHLFRAETAAKLGEGARAVLETYAATPRDLAQALGLVSSDPARQDWFEQAVYDRVKAKLAREAVEDFRVDFEDGFGNRPDAEEDQAAVNAAREVARGLAAGTLPPFLGIRVKTLSEELKRRAARTLDLFLTSLVDATGGKLPPHFIVTLPKVTCAEHVAAFCRLLDAAEDALRLPRESVKLEIMVETTQSIMASDGAANLPRLAAAGGTRLFGAHFGTYDYTASCNITAAHQSMDHAACDFARHMMKVAFAGTPVFLSDGATNVMPVGPHRAAAGGALSVAQQRENAEVVHRAWRLSFGHVSHSLRNAFYQGWDLHPAQLPVRYAACYAFFLDGLQQATDRLRTFIDKAAQATLLGDVFDDAATGQGLLNYFLRALNCGAVTLDEVRATGLSLEEIQSRSFLKILAGRRQLG